MDLKGMMGKKIDIKEIVTQAIEKISKDDETKKLFDKNPGKALEKIVGFELPEDKINEIVTGIKAKMNLDSAKSALGGLFNKK